jgi:hypothetical protein
MHACFMDALPYEDDGSVKIFNVVEGGETDGYFETLQAFAACISLSDSPSVAQGIASIGAGMVILGATGVQYVTPIADFTHAVAEEALAAMRAQHAGVTAV